MFANGTSTRLMAKGSKPRISIDEELELDDSATIHEPKGFNTPINQSPSSQPRTSKPIIAGMFLLIAFFLNLLLPITFSFLIFDAETASGETTLKGQIKDEDENPVANVTVIILDTNLQTVTDENGNYNFSNIPVGEHEIQFIKEGYHKVKVKKILFSKNLLDQLGYSENTFDIPSYLQNSVYVAPFDGPHNNTMVVNDNLNNTIFGIVYNISGEPVYNAKVEILNTNVSANSNDAGEYRLEGASPGIITIQVSNSITNIKTNITILFSVNQSLELNLTYNEIQDQDIDKVTGKFGEISGRVVDKKEKPVENVNIILDIDTGEYANNIMQSDNNGMFRFNDVPLGIYDLVIKVYDFEITNILNLTLGEGIDQNGSLGDIKLTKLKPIDVYEEDIAGAYICTVITIILALITLFGAISAFQRKRYSVAFIGAMVGMLPVFLPLRIDICAAGILCLTGLVLIVFSRNEFNFK